MTTHVRSYMYKRSWCCLHRDRSSLFKATDHNEYRHDDTDIVLVGSLISLHLYT